MEGRSEFDGGGDHRLRPGGLLDEGTYRRLERLCFFLSPWRFFLEAGLNGLEGAPGVAGRRQEAGPLLTAANRDYWAAQGLVIADAAGRVRVAGVEEEIGWLQEWLCFGHGPRLVSPVLGEPWRWFRIQRQELARRAEKAGRKALHEAAERQWDSRPPLPRLVQGRVLDFRAAPN
ncbi:MAG: hypothetical protein JO250_18770 [Armatimonadetes bacterium]|nr:hypothetical protein [Armatimonadota bacterium]